MRGQIMSVKLDNAWENAGVLGKILIAIPMAVVAAAFGYIVGALGMAAIGVVAWRYSSRKR